MLTTAGSREEIIGGRRHGHAEGRRRRVAVDCSRRAVAAAVTTVRGGAVGAVATRRHARALSARVTYNSGQTTLSDTPAISTVRFALYIFHFSFSVGIIVTTLLIIL